MVEKKTSPPGRARTAHAATSDAGSGHVLEQLETGHDVEPAGLPRRELLRRGPFVGHPGAALRGMADGDLDRGLPRVDAGDPRPAALHRFGEEAAPAAYVNHGAAAERRPFVDEVEPRGIDVVQGAEVALRVPPAGRDSLEAVELARVDVRPRLHVRLHLPFRLRFRARPAGFAPYRIRARHSRASRTASAASRVSTTPSRTTRRPATHTSRTWARVAA